MDNFVTVEELTAHVKELFSKTNLGGEKEWAAATASCRVAAFVRDARKHAKLTQIELARRVDTTQDRISKMETAQGFRDRHVGLLIRIADVCGGELSLKFKARK
ncbi:helix-turn-helix domain-containing protein [Candidatus Kaiserbacteria bacterium]|nr:helix-turn-helix domain-containing protein [Candidatus Kaiserbacteria bacterium]